MIRQSIFICQKTIKAWVRVGELPSPRKECVCMVLPNGKYWLLEEIRIQTKWLLVHYIYMIVEYYVCTVTWTQIVTQFAM